MDLRARLRLLRAAGVAGTVGAPGAGATGAGVPGNGAAEALIQGESRAKAVTGLWPGSTTPTTCGEAFYWEERFPSASCRGPLSLDHLLSLPAAIWSEVGGINGLLNLDQALFLDTETTGLAGGSGTYAFLVGLGYFSGDQFIIRQYFLRDYPEEDALLAAVAHHLSACKLLITFNGKSFDWPLLETRYRISRRQPPLPLGTPHLDLLHPARRLWKERLGACTLTNLEDQLLGIKRQGDVPGHLIPRLYLDYLRTKEALPLADVVKHNRWDILSLVSLMGWMGHLVAKPFLPAPDGEMASGDELFAVGRLLWARGQPERAIACLEEASRRGTVAVPRHRLFMELGYAYKRCGLPAEALQSWQTLLNQSAATAALTACIELAKHYEHVQRDFVQARNIVSHALELVHGLRSAVGWNYPSIAAEASVLKHRLDRLNRKVERQRAHTGFEPDIG